MRHMSTLLQGTKILAARMMGRTATVIITFEGTHIPHPVCLRCGGPHRADDATCSDRKAADAAVRQTAYNKRVAQRSAAVAADSAATTTAPRKSRSRSRTRFTMPSRHCFSSSARLHANPSNGGPAVHHSRNQPAQQSSPDAGLLSSHGDYIVQREPVLPAFYEKIAHATDDEGLEQYLEAAAEYTSKISYAISQAGKMPSKCPVRPIQSPAEENRLKSLILWVMVTLPNVKVRTF
ncbi:hypothetical protein HPB48_000893 [Haemaphysalis longicornis]|uniref:Uncharacterized protein n=1 Tax=Haemaphysalis longicornis TaxID=44386 RepID=A0A9J6GJM2_HAELO|nr:hypothetical protein HPB48_000893 [Haemaphysalis longicornis]